MKLLKLSAVALFMAFAFTACKKDQVTPSSKTAILGKWSGKLNTVTTNINRNYYFNIKSEGSELEIRFDDPNSPPFIGTWSLNASNNKFTGTYEDNGVINLTGTFDVANGKLDGDYEYINSEEDPNPGKFAMTKDK
ncbi:MAG: hypothetical protein WBP45_06065 [Daejeonella sp.]